MMNAIGKQSMAVLLAVLAALSFTACQTATPATRIEENPVMFRALSAEQQLMVQQGRICKGMTKDAVFLAWGKPAGAPMVGEKDGKRFERWVYTVSRAVPVDGFGGCWYGDPWCRHGWGPYGWGPCGGMNVAYVPEQVASVTFENDRVTEWESSSASRR